MNYFFDDHNYMVFKMPECPPIENWIASDVGSLDDIENFLQSYRQFEEAEIDGNGYCIFVDKNNDEFVIQSLYDAEDCHVVKKKDVFSALKFWRSALTERGATGE